MLVEIPLSPRSVLILRRGDITALEVDAIVNAANSRMLGGGGVDGAIHRAAGHELLEACRAIPAPGGLRCPPGEARVTPGFELPARHVIHTVGPIFRSDPDPPGTLASAYRASLELANSMSLSSVAFPAISCGVYGYPLAEAADIALSAVREHHGALDQVHFVLFGEDTFTAWATAAGVAETVPGA
ncbi:MAG TPA: O-acetyl-ADP-ribose deacetylase [Myxococcota bacterium]|nr:O-acetyl-ADP-ribose deacetylase [Myxococcota bacterium]